MAPLIDLVTSTVSMPVLTTSAAHTGQPGNDGNTNPCAFTLTDANNCAAIVMAIDTTAVPNTIGRKRFIMNRLR